MSKILGSWSGMRKYLEQEMLAECLHGRVKYICTTYTGMEGFRIFEIFIDGKCAKRFSWETVNTYFINNGFKQNNDPHGYMEYWDEFIELKWQIPLMERTEYTDEEFCEALEKYRNQDVQTSIHSENPIVRMFALLDRRVGRRTLESLEDSLKEQPQWIEQFYRLRIDKQAK